VGVFSFLSAMARLHPTLASGLFPIRYMAEKYLRTYYGGVSLLLLYIHPEED
jgi:hypothetical protein